MRLYQPDPDLPGAQCLLDPDCFGRQIRPWFTDDPIASLAIQNVRYKPQTSCLVGYQVTTHGGCKHWLHTKAFRNDDWSLRKRKWDDSRNRFLTIDSLAVAITRFPSDQKLPAIALLAENPEAFLDRILLDEYPRSSVIGYEVLAYKPNRRFVARVNLESADPLVLKIFDPEKFQQASDAASFLKKNLVTGLPDRVGRSSRHLALAYSWIPGRPSDLHAGDSDSARKEMHRIIDFLDQSQIPRSPKRSQLPIQSPGNGILQMADYLGTICTPIRDRSERIARHILGHLAVRHPFSLIHGDFHERQLLVDEQQVRACDFDNCSLGDPLADIANLIAHLQFRTLAGNLSTDRVEAVESVVLERLATDAAASDRYHWLNAASLFRLGSHSFRGAQEDWVETTQRLLDLVDQRMDAAPGTQLIQGLAASDANATPSRQHSFANRKSRRDRRPYDDDPSFEYLRSAFEIGEASRVLHDQVPLIEKKWGTFSVDRTILRRHKAHRRCLVEFRLSTEQGPVSILGKSSVRRWDRRTWQAQRELWEQHGFQKSDGELQAIFVPEPLGGCRTWKMWFQSFVSGNRGDCVLKALDDQQAFGRVSEAIAKLHRSSFQPQRHHRITDEMAILRARLYEVAAEVPRHAPAISRILKHCEQIAVGISELKPHPLHRDFYHDQLILEGPHLCVVDWDLACLGHPALDVGNFCAHLVEWGIREEGDPNRWAAREDELIDQYLVRMPHVSRHDIQAYRVLSLARHVSISWQIRSRRRTLAMLVDCVDGMAGKLLSRTGIERPV